MPAKSVGRDRNVETLPADRVLLNRNRVDSGRRLPRRKSARPRSRPVRCPLASFPARCARSAAHAGARSLPPAEPRQSRRPIRHSPASRPRQPRPHSCRSGAQPAPPSRARPFRPRRNRRGGSCGGGLPRGWRSMRRFAGSLAGLVERKRCRCRLRPGGTGSRRLARSSIRTR